MVKKIDVAKVTIKGLLDSGINPAKIIKEYKDKKNFKHLKLTFQKLYYWKNNDFKTEIKRRTKLNHEEIEIIRKMAENKTTTEMSSRKIADKMNKLFESKGRMNAKGKKFKIGKSTICKYLNNDYGRPRRIRKVFALSEKNKKKRVNYCENLIKNKIIGKNIFFTDETAIKCSSFSRGEQIRLSKENSKKLKKGDPEVLKLMERKEEKFPKSLMLAGGISYYGLSDLIIVEGTMTEFAYGQAILLYKKNMEEFKKINKNIIFEQDGATCHTSKANQKLLNIVFGEEGQIQNSPSSPDLAYPIETVWAELKDRVRRRAPNTIEELKKYCLEEWNKIEPKKYFKNFEAKIKLCKQINGERLNEYNLREIRRKTEEKIGKEKEIENKIERKFKRVFNENVLLKYKKKEIKELEKKKKDLPDYYDQKIKEKEEEIKDEKKLEKMSGKKIDSDNQVNLELLKITKEQEMEETEKKLKEIKKMTVYQYLKYFLKKEEKKEDKSPGKAKKNPKIFKKSKNDIKTEIKKDEKDNKMKIEEEIEDNYDEETRDEVRDTMKPILELEKLQEKNKEICYDFEF